MRRRILALAASVAFIAGPAAGEGDPIKGEKQFAKCKACHQVGEDAKNRIGPSLNGTVDRSFGAVEGFKYSAALRGLAEAGKVWDVATLDAYLKNPKSMVPKGSMAFPGVKDDAQRADLIAYLMQIGPNGKPK